MTIREELDFIAKRRLLILDGATGSMIQSKKFTENEFRGSRFKDHPFPLSGCNDILCLTNPDVIAGIHNAYLGVGADIIETCSFNSTAISLNDYGIGDLAYEISAAAANIARNAADKFSNTEKKRFVAGSIGPTAKGASLYPDINDPYKHSVYWDELETAYYDNARGLIDGGADIFLVETVFDTLNAKAALYAINRLLDEKQIDIPVIISATVSGESGQLLSGQSLDVFCISVFHAKPWAVGLNCSSGAEKLLPHIRQLAANVPCLVSAYPNAGFPNQYGLYDETPKSMSDNIEAYMKEGLVNIIGGCCGSTPDHIASIAAKAENYKPRNVEKLSFYSGFCGLQPIEIHENTINPAHNKELLALISNGEYEDAADTARDIADNGAQMLTLKIDDELHLSRFLDYALMDPYISKIPFLIESSQWNVIETGLKKIQGRCLAGSVSLSDGDDLFVQRINTILQYGAAVLLTIAGEKEKADNFEYQTEIIERMSFLLKKHNIDMKNIVIDIRFYGSDNEELSNIRSLISNNCPDACFLV
ncbi:MAG: homocysteine S-methyltransferase family protein [Treponema sp.]|jgi:5-methyltetrahydrofolate--homocysteine methyltransferase|nr:homocysteine S-methyltransferase family protein [Treponema sp.]